MNLDAVNPELESKINDLVCETYNKPFLEQEKLLKEAFELIPKPVTQWAHPTTMVTIALFELYYKNQKYAFDPKNDPYNSDYDWTEEVDEEEMKREIPKEMYMALDGEVLESPNWEEGIPTALSEIMDKLCDALDE